MSVSPLEMSHTPQGCRMAGFLHALTRPWTLHILWHLSKVGTLRFGELRRSVSGISARMLALRLRELEGAGFVKREQKSTQPLQVSYSITPRMRELEGIFEQLSALLDSWNPPTET